MARLPLLNAVKAFEATGRHLNFRLAAEEIGVTQGVVAQHVRALEDRMDVKLFERLPRVVCADRSISRLPASSVFSS